MVEGWLVVLSLGVTLTLLSLMRDRFFSLLGRGWLFRVYAAPGVFIHELSHALTAILVGFNITHISFFSPQPDGTLGFVQYKYRPSIISPLLRLFVGIAPLFGGLFVVCLLNWLCQAPTLTDWSALYDYAAVEPVRFGIWLYLTSSVVANAVPSKVDLNNSYIALYCICFMIGALPFSYAPLLDLLTPIMAMCLFVVLLFAAALSLGYLSRQLSYG
ncbi:M50 family metallopeptidase [Shewanella baltica]|uniref:M50 family peptidase n=1 Tax=Shewanella decolorationis TaxID=256839 RepID=A0A5B8R344_9GAMM|nr:MULTISPECIES: M50 family metallopeptidase [Shewanella]MCU8019354.1 M50 family metallopeptidase [Shewanella sp. SM72]MCU8022787.1 M50 family metallopeptidase [Shewanella sp. SM78]MCU8040663.1 M50 family metallopeptidase [Shewanella sp. SM69]MCU8079778.1 M50 family metallopeptidase [Shewanella sp. SM103]MDH0450939.1 M50 family metallopeptidase [Shewanella sp. GD04112]